MIVRPKHRDVLGISWRPSRFCTHPLHGFRKGKCDTGVSDVSRNNDEVEQVSRQEGLTPDWKRFSCKHYRRLTEEGLPIAVIQPGLETSPGSCKEALTKTVY